MSLNVTKYNKAIVAVGAAVAVIVKASADGSIDTNEVVEMVIVILGALGVYAAPNIDPEA